MTINGVCSLNGPVEPLVDLVQTNACQDLGHSNCW